MSETAAPALTRKPHLAVLVRLIKSLPAEDKAAIAIEAAKNPLSFDSAETIEQHRALREKIYQTLALKLETFIREAPPEKLSLSKQRLGRFIRSAVHQEAPAILQSAWQAIVYNSWEEFFGEQQRFLNKIRCNDDKDTQNIQIIYAEGRKAPTILQDWVFIDTIHRAVYHQFDIACKKAQGLKIHVITSRQLVHTRDN
ncbi:MAG: hypothetical protein AB7G80_04440 [Dongiaceae bacterium]